MGIILENIVKHKVDIGFLEKIANVITKKDIELILCDNNYIKELNLNFRQIDSPTDVLSFPLEDMPYNTLLGSIVISFDFAKQYSNCFKHSIDHEISLLFIHGLLHLVGFDHEVNNAQHRNKEEELIKQFDLPSSLIVRTQEEIM